VGSADLGSSKVGSMDVRRNYKRARKGGEGMAGIAEKEARKGEGKTK